MVTLEAIKEARSRIQPYILKTPYLPVDFLNRNSDRTIFMKCEALQRTGSFKIRGAANCILQNLAQSKRSGVVAASAGNHAQGVACIAHFLGIKATIVMPKWTPQIKVQNTERWGATVELVGEVYDDSYEHANRLATEKGFLFIHPFRDPNIIAGQGTIALELLEETAFSDAEAVVVSIGGGGIITGIATALRALKPGLKIYGVTAKNAPGMWKSFHTGQLAQEDVRFTLAEGVAVKKPDPMMLKTIETLVDDVFSISEEAIASAITMATEHGKIVLEGAGALPIAAVLEDQIPEKKVALVLAGGNIDIPALSHVLERGMTEQGRLVRFLITITDRPGGLNAVTGILAQYSANILQVFHQRTSLATSFGEAEIEVELETRGKSHTDEILKAITAKGFRARTI